MAMDKKVMYALIGGMAVIGAAIALNAFSKAPVDEDEETLDQDLEDIGEVENEHGHMKFE